MTFEKCCFLFYEGGRKELESVLKHGQIYFSLVGYENVLSFSRLIGNWK